MQGQITGRAAARTMRASMPTNRSKGMTEDRIDSAACQPGRMDSGTTL
ncbi:hypothetical protein ABZ484_28970 [Streptomyces sp. NPDC006393]